MSKALRRWIPVFALLVIALAVFPVISSANHSWNGYHWARTANPFTIKLGDNVNSTWEPILATTSSDWSKSTVLSTTIVAGGTSPKRCRPTAGQDEICNSTYGNTGWLGVAQIWLTTGNHIAQGTVKLNDTYHNSPPYNTTAWRNLVSCQEVGHTFGLDHQDTNFNNTNLGTCMDYTSNPQGPPDNEHPNKHDYDELVTIYSHVDDFNSYKNLVAQMPPAMRDIDLAGPAQWGRLIGATDRGMTSVYEADFGNGFKVITYVIWADPDLMGTDARDHYPLEQ